MKTKITQKPSLGLNQLILIFILVTLAFASACQIEPDTDVEDIQVYFTRSNPGDESDGCDLQLVSLFNNAKSEINCAVYSFNRPNIAEALVNARKRGVTVRIILDSSQANSASNSARTKFLEENIEQLKIITLPGIANMHHKFAVIDRKIVVTGSYNWTANATNNSDENMIVITSKSLAQEYNREFNKIWQHTSQ